MNFLTHDELIELTGFQWKSKQRDALVQMGVKFTVNPRGRILVPRSVLDDKPRRKVAPDWSALEKVA